ncbi:MAG: hypothetical protein LC747_04505, partial [Acidobacteria bacterium]|nr:hypothetical protein [Acidobacteriota bacterium]
PRRMDAERTPEAAGFSPEVVRVAFDRKGRIGEITGDGVTLAVSTATLSQWASSDATASASVDGGGIQRDETAAPSLSAPLAP